MDLSSIDTIAFVMMENRSFDHVLGYLSLPPWNQNGVDGLRDDLVWQNNVANPFAGDYYRAFRLADPNQKLPGDPPHERSNIATQLGSLGPHGYAMDGFVKSCAALDPDTRRPIVMGYFDGDELRTSDFFARHYAICDQWFSSLPAGTQPNRLMSMSGYSEIEVNARVELPNQKLVYDWLRGKGIRWRVYHDGIPFFAMMPRWIPDIVAGKDFKAYNHLRIDVKSEDEKTFPQVIFIEPRYTDAPHIEAPTDDHAPSPIANGQNYLMKVYNDLTCNVDRWAKMVVIVTYDEHGGFFDHVSPPLIPTLPPSGATYQKFDSLGVRVPAYVISPLVQAGTICHEVMDHLSVLKFIAEKFSGGDYSAEVNDRPVASVSDVLGLDIPRQEIAYAENAQAGFTPQHMPGEPTPNAFAKALDTMAQNYPEETGARFPELVDQFQ